MATYCVSCSVLAALPPEENLFIERLTDYKAIFICIRSQVLFALWDRYRYTLFIYLFILFFLQFYKKSTSDAVLFGT